MNFQEIERNAQIIERRFDLASTSKRREMAPAVAQTIRELKLHNHPVPRPLARVEAAIERETFEDMFDNMPV